MTVGVSVGAGVGVIVGVRVAVGVPVGVSVGVSVGVARAMNAPIVAGVDSPSNEPKIGHASTQITQSAKTAKKSL